MSSAIIYHAGQTHEGFGLCVIGSETPLNIQDKYLPKGSTHLYAVTLKVTMLVFSINGTYSYFDCVHRYHL
jgi:hypothetical protein